MRADVISINTERITVNGRPLSGIVAEMLERHPSVRVRIGTEFDHTFEVGDLSDFDGRLVHLFEDTAFKDGELVARVLIEPAR